MSVKDPSENRVEGFMQTYTGQEYHFSALTPGQVLIGDIAHSLSLVCRFNGHCSEFYSVAQHSMLVAYVLAVQLNRPDLLKWGLYHDAGETYIGDMLWGLKHDSESAVGREFRKLEEGVDAAIAQRFGLSLPKPPEVKLADRIVLAVETGYLMGGRVEQICNEPFDRPDWADRFRPLGSTVAEHRFLGWAEFVLLTNEAATPPWLRAPIWELFPPW